MTQERILDQIHHCFSVSFQESEKVLLKGGFSEPFYLAKNSEGFSEIHYRSNYPSSALHEIAHWCVAGKEKRKLDDFGYWYEPDGRNEKQQKRFFEVEARPQAYEYLLSAAFNLKFQFSIDNLNGCFEIPKQFKLEFSHIVETTINKGNPHRLGKFLNFILTEMNDQNTICLKNLLGKHWKISKQQLNIEDS